jgi:diketogulonate reductase-like aldo/keto reductase
MQQHTFGPIGTGKGGAAVAAIGQGTWYIEQGERKAAVAALKRGLDRGMTHIDTAELYGSGAAETIVAEAIAGRRDEVFLVSKVMPQNASRKGTVAACEASLKRLKVDRLDCYLLHWRGRHPLAETIAAFEDLVTAGKIATWGVSNFDGDDLAEAEGIAGPGRIACNQVLYHLEERGIEHAVIPWCEAHGVAVVGYSPFGHGGFPAPSTSGGRVLADIATAHGATARQVALAFLTRRPSLFAIPKAASAAHTEENAAAGDLSLSAAEAARIDKAFPLGPRGSLAML